ncbi:glycosyltransferase [Rhodococcus sp. Eu-32]|uniref:glycosyltransferase n=1 Tax=Rhodococcus sp. Eu-32 TaxID=1017319 RepID=UPI001403A593|nr:glycosyltransferase [Rhodococcus sp. Eu-32]
MVLTNLVQGWSTAFPDDELILAVPASVDSVDLDGVDEFEVVRTRGRMHPVINAVELPILAKHYDIDAIFAQNFSPLFGRSAVFIHDVLFQSNPEWFTRGERLYLSLIPRLARHATSIVTSSKTEARRIRRINRRLQSVHAVGLSISEGLSSASSAAPSGHGSVSRFVLTAGRINSRKNLVRTLVGALRSGALSVDCPLLVVGEESGKTDAFGEDVATAVDQGLIKFLGYVSNDELRWLYEQCQFFCYLSLDEGFGLTPLEATFFGAPCLVSDISVFHENLNRPGVDFVDPYNVDDIAGAFRSLANRTRPTVEVSRRSGAAAIEPQTWGASATAIRKSLVSSELMEII